MADESKKEKPKIYVDDDWKQEAQKEKERLSEKEKQKEASPEAGGAQKFPPVTFEALVGTFATQALLSMGLVNHPDAKKMVNLDLAKLNIDLLGIVEEKTKGNLTNQEKQSLDQTIHQLRMAFVQVTSAQSGPIGT